MIIKLLIFSFLFAVIIGIVMLSIHIIDVAQSRKYMREENKKRKKEEKNRKSELKHLNNTPKLKFDKAANCREKIKTSIDNISKKIELYEQVLDHIKNGGGATGLVWDYSPYMTEESTEQILIELKNLKVYLKDIYSEMMVNQTLKEIDEDLGEMIKFEFETLDRQTCKNLEEILELIEKKYGLKE